MSDHTPGPWTISGISMNNGSISVGSDKYRIVIADVTNAASFGDMLVGAIKRAERGEDGGPFDPSDAKTQFANARLIAAAPDMLDALRSAEGHLEEMRKDAKWHPIGDCPVLRKVRAAIAKTEASR